MRGSEAMSAFFDLKGGVSVARRICDRTRGYLLGATLGGSRNAHCAPYLHIPRPYEHGKLVLAGI